MWCGNKFAAAGKRHGAERGTSPRPESSVHPMCGLLGTRPGPNVLMHSGEVVSNAAAGWDFVFLAFLHRLHLAVFVSLRYVEGEEETYILFLRGVLFFHA